MLLRGLPDFQNYLDAAGNLTFAAYEITGEYILLPDCLAPVEPDGKNRACRLTFVRGASPKMSPEPHGMFECLLSLRYREEEALQSIRKLRPEAVLRPANFSRGIVYLELPNENRVSRELNGFGPLFREFNFSLKLSEEAACMAKYLSEKNFERVFGRVELMLEGISPRLPVKVLFDYPGMLAGMERFFGKGQDMGRPEILKFFSQPPRALPLEITGISREEIRAFAPGLLAQILTDRFINRFGTRPVSGMEGSFEWDLSVPHRTSRSYTLPLRVLADPGKDAPCQKVEIPVFRTEPRQVKISADLPSRIYGLFSLGVTLRVPGKSEMFSKSMELKLDEKYEAVISRGFSLTTESEYAYSTFAVVRSPYGPKLLKSPEKTHKGDRLNLTVRDFPLDFVWVEAARRLLRLAELQGSCTWLEDGLEISQPFDFVGVENSIGVEASTGEKPCRLAISVPWKGDRKKWKRNPLMEIRALSRTEEKRLHLVRRAGSLRLDLPSFPEYGPQKLEIRCSFEPGVKYCILEFLPEGKEPCRENAGMLHFTPSCPLQEWTWFADSPFRRRYRFRRRELNKEPGPWSALVEPSVPLRIRVKAGGKQKGPEKSETN